MGERSSVSIRLIMQVKFLPLLILSLHALSARAQSSFYDINQIQEIKLTFFQTNWDAKLDSLKSVNEEAYLLAKSVEINGEVFDSVGVKYKGNSTYKATNAKNPLHIELDYVRAGQNYKGLKDVKLGNCYFDATFIREALAYEILQKYMAAPKANFAKLYMGGVYYGVYSNQQSINKSFARDNFYTDGQNPFFKCNPQSIGGPGGTGGFPDLVYSSADSTTYYKKYELKSDYGWRQLLGLMDTLKNHPNSADKVVDIDRALWMHAFNAVTVNLDSYTGAFGQNYYLYMDDNGRFMPIVWDLNMCFGSFSNLSNGNLSVAQMQNLDPLTQATNASRPLISKLLANATYKRMYLAHIRTLFEENFADTKYRDRALELQAIIAADVQVDTKKFYTNAQFTSNIDAQLTSGGMGGSIPGITQLMNARNTFLKNNVNFTAAAPVLTTPVFTPAVPVSGASVAVTAEVQNATKVWIGSRLNPWDVFQRTEMFDDGQHNDGATGDGVYGGNFIAGPAKTQIYMYAENATSGRFLPERAEYEFINLPSELPLPNVGDVVINEILASNSIGATDEKGQYEDWVELYNKTNQAQNLFGLYLTDNPDNPDKWDFPNGTFIPASGFLIVWADEDSSQGPLHANFKLSAGGEFVMLSNGSGLVFDSISFGQQQTDVSFGRFPNGTGNFTVMSPTFGKVNSLTSGTGEAQAAISLRVFPNPASAELVLRSDDVALEDIAVFDVAGRLMHRQQFDAPAAEHRIAVADWQAGVYFVRVNGVMAVTFVKM